MSRRAWGAVAAIVAGVALASAQAPRPGRSAGTPRAVAQPGPRAVGSVRDVMRSMTVPSSDVVFGAGAEPPATPEAWETLRLNAVALAESANLLMIGSRVRDRADWLTMARAQLDAAEQVVRLAEARTRAGLAEASDKTYDTCTTCHNKYWAERNRAE